jgi:Holliday junction resolvase
MAGNGIVRLVVQCKHNQSKFGPEDTEELIRWSITFSAIPILASNDSKGHIVTSRVEKTGMRPITV